MLRSGMRSVLTRWQRYVSTSNWESLCVNNLSEDR